MSSLESLLYPIADMVQADLYFKANKKRVEGARKFKITVVPGVELDIDLEAVSSFVNLKSSQAGVLFHVRGKMYLLVVHNYKHSSMGAYVISSQDLGNKRIDMVDYLPKMGTIKTAVDKVSKGVRQAYMRTTSDPSWTKIKIPTT